MHADNSFKRAGTRDTARTRRAILAAASRLIARNGLRVGLNRIAEEAGVSKSGLLHHFPARDMLLDALIREMYSRLRQNVYERIDLTENRPGKLLRAYVRAMCDDFEAILQTDPSDSEMELDWGAWVVIRSNSETSDIEQQDALQWDRELAADGLDQNRALLVRLAADGLAAFAQLDADLARDYIARMRPLLLALTEDTGPLTA
ncbi:TetR/AcrR family transcriptional regulator [Streptomyces sp. NPDC086081]|uniref:TetR/AcrR family transcriptional regulator n=1 Tax=Streptomyces sp. NPDC086081 TaxID=3365749 RepID=UPI0037F5F491